MVESFQLGGYRGAPLTTGREFPGMESNHAYVVGSQPRRGYRKDLSVMCGALYRFTAG